jgi:hypothetical protein
MTHQLDIIIVERLGSLKILSVKDFKEEELYKRCGFKKQDNFIKQTEWNVKCDGNKYCIQVFGKSEGRANTENKYDFPPPIDTKLFYGSCCIIGQIKKEDGTKNHFNLTIPLWSKIYEKLFGGFEDLALTAKEDEEEDDELKNVPKEKKTKQGYLKDGFVVDSSDTEDGSTEIINSDEEEEEEEEEDWEGDNMSDGLVIEDIGSELTEEAYDYDDDNVDKNVS